MMILNNVTLHTKIPDYYYIFNIQIFINWFEIPKLIIYLSTAVPFVAQTRLLYPKSIPVNNQTSMRISKNFGFQNIRIET